MAAKGFYWEDLSNSLSDCFSNPVKISKDEYIVVPWNCSTKTNMKSNSLYIYNTITSKWRKSIEYPLEFETYKNTAAYDDDRKLLYTYGRNEKRRDCLTIFDLENNNVNIISNIKQFGLSPMSIVINNQLHIIGGSRNNKHCIWNEDKQIFEEIYCFDDNQNFPSISKAGLVYIESKQMLLLIGGRDWESMSSIYTYSFNQKHQHYKVWKRANIDLLNTLHSFGCTVSKNEKYVIIVGGICDQTHEHRQDIFVIDLEEWTVKVSQCKISSDSPIGAVMMDNKLNTDLLTNGFIKRCWKESVFDEMRILSNDSINVICSYIIEEYLHIIQTDSNIAVTETTKHWKISLPQILETL